MLLRPEEHVLEILPLEIARARDKAARSGRPLVEVLEDDCGLTREEFLDALGRALSYHTLDWEGLQAMRPAFDVLPLSDAKQRRCLALRDGSRQLLLVTDDPFELSNVAWVEERVREPVEWAIVHREDMNEVLLEHEAGARALDSVAPLTAAKASAPAAGVASLSLQTISDDESPTVRLVNSTLYDALKAAASDLHFETDPEGLVVKYRIDGVLAVAARARGTELADQVLSRIKVMSELDIAERRIPQDGRFQVMFEGRPVDFRVSVMPSIHGEDAVLRVLDKKSLADEAHGLRLEVLGLDAYAISAIRELAARPYGLLLATGPTGSGKTTTLYATVSEINQGHDKIITIEDPVEYQLPGVLQIPVNERKGLSFARGLRSILRHDPDKILVGEVRDAETAQIAVQAALTGHLVLTTVHANSVFDLIGRIANMGVDSFSFAAAVNGILAQRLVRVNCPHCTKAEQPDAALLRASGLGPDAIKGFTFRRGVGCAHCRGTGYKGRRAIVEILVLDDEMRDLIAQRESIRTIRRAAIDRGTRMLREVAIDLVRQGVTSLQEINRVTAVV